MYNSNKPTYKTLPQTVEQNYVMKFDLTRIQQKHVGLRSSGKLLHIDCKNVDQGIVSI